MGKKKTKRGNSSIHLRKEGRWEGRVVIGRNEADGFSSRSDTAPAYRTVW